MTPAEIIAMAKEAWGDGWFPALHTFINDFERFAALVAAKEREACAQVCDQFAEKTMEEQQGPSDQLSNIMLRQVALLGHGECATAIRARGQS